MYVIIYDTLVKIFENISRKKVSWNNLYLRERGKSFRVQYLWNLKRSEIYPTLNLEEKCYMLDQDLTIGCQRHSAAWNN